jgi:two-component system CheB/CheR fusion protein
MSFFHTNDIPDDIFQTIFEKSPGSLLVKADLPRFTIVAASEGYLKITSSIKDAIIGKGFFEAFPEENVNIEIEKNARTAFTKVIATKEKFDVANYRYDVYNAESKSYQEHYWTCSNVPVFCNGPEVAFILNTVVDITAEVKATAAAKESENRLRLAADAASLATWDYGITDNSFNCSPRLLEIFGHSDNYSIRREEMQQQIDAADMENIVVPAYTEAFKTGNYVYEVKIYRPDGNLRWIKTQGVVIYTKTGAPDRMLGTVVDITEIKRDEIRKNDFIAMASHELKTPLTSLKAYIQLLEKKLEGAGDSFVSNILLKADRQINKMTNLIHSFLDLSKLEPGKLQLNFKEFDINKIIDDAVTEMRHNAHFHLINFGQLDKIIVVADNEKISQVISNFLSNAIKYSQKGSTVTVKSKKVANFVEVSVEDEGVGIEPEHREKLFQRFYRVENEKLKNTSGFGIGLYLASEIIQQHKGKIWLESEVGKGSVFYFSLPL